MDLESTLAWIARIVSIITLGFTVCILRSEFKFRKSSTLKNNGETPNIYKKILSFWSAVSLISCVITSCFLLSICFRFICLYVYSFARAFIIFNRMTLTFYQIARLHYCFRKSSSGDIYMYGYHQSVFFTWYIVGIIIVISFSVWVIKPFPIHHNQYQCLPWQIVPTDIQILITSILMLIYIIWDSSILIAYIIKNYQLKQNIKHNETISKITVVLHKIIVITIISQAISICLFLFMTFLQNTLLAQIVDEMHFLPAMDIVFVSIFMYLMIDHNTEKYLKLVRMCTCCCSSEPNNTVSVWTTSDSSINGGTEPENEGNVDLEIKKRTINLTTTSNLKFNFGSNTDTAIDDNGEEMEEHDSQRTTTSDLEHDRQINMEVLKAMKAKLNK